MANRRASATLVRAIVAAVLGGPAPASMLALSLAGVFAASEIAAVAQEPLPWQRLAELTIRKGRSTQDPLLCLQVQLHDETRQCKIYQALYKDKVGYSHALNVYEEQSKGSIHVILFKRSEDANRRETTAYLVGLDGRLRAVSTQRRFGDPTFIELLDINSSEAKEGLAAEIAYWRAQQRVLEKEPDR
jgi:hypothetical protein